VTTFVAIVVAIVASGLAAVFAAADGALLALDADDARLDGSLRALAERRERSHRALAFARIVAHLVAGCAIASALRFSDRSLGASLLIAVPVALVAVLLSSVARSIGTQRAPRRSNAWRPWSVVERVLASRIVGAWLDNLIQSVIPPTRSKRIARRPPSSSVDRRCGADVTTGRRPFSTASSRSETPLYTR
jgi:hypothetical protein